LATNLAVLNSGERSTMNYHNTISMNVTYMSELLKINTYSHSRLPKGTAVEWQLKKVEAKYNKNSTRNNDLFLQGKRANRSFATRVSQLKIWHF
jgi:hypothetical protein